MYKTASRRLQRYNAGKVEFGFSYPEFLKEEYEKEYQYKCTQQEFYSIIKAEIETCRIPPSGKKPDYTLWFGKYQGEKLFDIEDVMYLRWMCAVCRKKIPKLVEQALLRLDEITTKEYEDEDE
jgi:uncharacterized protein (DUF3820 family)